MSTPTPAPDPCVAVLLDITRTVHGDMGDAHTVAYGWLSAAVKELIDGTGTVDDLARDLSVTEVFLMQYQGERHASLATRSR